MPDLKSELEKVAPQLQSLDNLAFDDEAPADAPGVAPGVTPGVAPPVTKRRHLTSANLYAFIEANPGLTCGQMRPHFIKNSQLSTRLFQAVKNGFMTREVAAEGYIYFRTDKQPLSEAEKAQRLETYRVKYQGEQRAASKARKAVAKAKQTSAGDSAPVIATTWDADTIIDNLGLKQAKALYEELKKYFG